MKKSIISIFCLFWIGLAGCNHTDGPKNIQPLDVRVIHKSTTCGKLADIPDALWIADKAHLKTVFDKMNRHQIGGQLPGWVEDFDFNDFGILFVHMGQKSTGGFHLEYEPGHASVSDHRATVVLKWMVPDADAMVTQMVTHPCIMLTLPKTDFTRLEVLDQHGRVKAVVNRNAPD